MKEHTGEFQELQNFQSGQHGIVGDRGGGKLWGRSMRWLHRGNWRPDHVMQGLLGGYKDFGFFTV